MLSSMLSSLGAFFSILCSRRKASPPQSRPRTARLPPEMVPLPPSPALLPRPASRYGRRHEVECLPAVGFLPTVSSIALDDDDGQEHVTPVARLRSFSDPGTCHASVA
ncbi:Nn.00g085620.m01.CDS01 [Neocucurbitaria sp. VM-36]